MPLVSVGIPTYNRCTMLQTAVDSILKQTYPNIEIVISDNASTDGTREYCLGLAANFNHVRYYRQENNVGATANFKFVLGMARGEFFFWQADDDLVDPLYVQLVLEGLHDPGTVLCATDVKYIDVLSGKTEVRKLTRLYAGGSAVSMANIFFRLRGHVSFATYGICRRRDLLAASSETKPLWYKKMELEYFLLATLSLRGRILALPLALRTYVVHNQNLFLEQSRSLNLWQMRLVETFIQLRLLRIALVCPGRPTAKVLAIVMALAGLVNHLCLDVYVFSGSYYVRCLLRNKLRSLSGNQSN